MKCIEEMIKSSGLSRYRICKALNKPQIAYQTKETMRVDTLIEMANVCGYKLYLINVDKKEKIEVN